VATRKQQTKVGIFLIVCIAIMAVLVVLTMGVFQEVGQPYWCQFEESVLGLSEGSVVEYLGVPVGKVTNIRVTHEGLAEVDLAVDGNKVQLYKGVEAKLVLYSLAAGTMAISLSGGAPELGPIPPTSRIPVQASTITAISGKVEDLTNSITAIVNQLESGLVGMEEGDLTRMLQKAELLLDDGSAFLQETTGTVEDVRVDIREALDRIPQITEDLELLADNANQFLATANGKIEPLDIQKTNAELQRVLSNVGDLSERMNETVKQFDNITASILHEADNIEYVLRTGMDKLRETFGNVQVFVDEIRQDPSSVLRGRGTVEEGS
jgi:phospholipid/cholesterol/gamma-HCH transport system substrate-binding protein